MKKPENYKFVVAGNEVIAISSFAGRRVKGRAKCHPEDTFDLETGKFLAAARCNAKIAEKRYKRARDKYEKICREVERLNIEFSNSCDYLTSAYERMKLAKQGEAKILEEIRK